MCRHGRSPGSRQESDCFERSETCSSQLTPCADELIVVRYLGWLSIDAKTFNVGQYRRNLTPNPTADFFDTANAEGERLRKAAAEAAVADMVKWFDAGEGLVAILDATNSTKARRAWIRQTCDAANVQTLFVESQCDDEELIMSNIREVKLTSPDYKGQDPELAAQDFRRRIRNYEKVYQTLGDDEADLTYCKLINVGHQFIINGIRDYLQSRVVYYLMNLHIRPRSIWLSRVGEVKWFVGLVTDTLSMGNQNLISLAESVEMQTSVSEANCMHKSCRKLSKNLQAISSSRSGRPP